MGGSGGLTRQLTLNVRGEILADINQIATYSANGALMGDGNYQSGGAYNTEAPNGLQSDMRTGMITAITNPYWSTGFGPGAYVYTYDGAGRQTNATDYPGWPNLASPSPGPGYSTTYDAENHTLTTGNDLSLCQSQPLQVAACEQGGVTAQWGSDGRQRNVTFNSQNFGVSLTAHWDGNAVLFATGNSKTGAWLYIGKDAMMDSIGDIYVSDRDQTGEQQVSHGSIASPGPYAVFPFSQYPAWYGSWFPGGSRSVFLAKLNWGRVLASALTGRVDSRLTKEPLTAPLSFPPFDMTRPDGYGMVGGNVQGARTFDQVSGQWLTPDAYAGDVHDPMSQKPFMWNNNNPVQWSDPSGYEGCGIGGLCGQNPLDPPKLPSNVDVYAKA